MKYIILLTLGLALSTANAADRCTGKVSNKLIENEFIANMYFDVALHQVICEYAGTKEQYDKAVEQWQAVRTKYKACIIAGQDALVAYFGGEIPFENFYAAIGNQISLTNLPDPCGRVDKLATALLEKDLSCRKGIIKVYRPHFEHLVAKYAEKSTGVEFRRVCDKQ